MVKAQANVNIALIKYWGKKDEILFLPYTSSLSLTLDNLYTITTVEKISNQSDIFILDDKLMSQAETIKVSKFIDFFRTDQKRLKIISHNNFPTAAGLASSASGYAALATALNQLYQLNLNKPDLSKLTRLGSGSASRSLFDKFAVWQTGDNETSQAYHLASNLDIEMIIVIIDEKKKSFSSRDMMKKTVEQSRYYQAFVKQSKNDFKAIIKAIADLDIDLVGQIAERNAFMMHGTMLALEEPFLYLKPESFQVIEFVRELRNSGLVAYLTMDAGPNLKIITDSKNSSLVLEKLSNEFSYQLIHSRPGKGSLIL